MTSKSEKLKELKHLEVKTLRYFNLCSKNLRIDCCLVHKLIIFKAWTFLFFVRRMFRSQTGSLEQELGHEPPWMFVSLKIMCVFGVKHELSQSIKREISWGERTTRLSLAWIDAWQWPQPEKYVINRTVYVQTSPKEDNWLLPFPFKGQDMMNDYVYKCVSSIFVQSHKPFLWSQPVLRPLSRAKQYE